jgi:hypothetical protein
VDGSDTLSFSVMDFAVSSTDISGSATRELVI